MNKITYKSSILLIKIFFLFNSVTILSGCSTDIISINKDNIKFKDTGSDSLECDKLADDAIKNADYETGIKLHLDYLNKFPNNSLSFYHLGYAYGQIEDHDKEAYYYEKAINAGFKENDSIFFNLGMAYIEQNKIKESIIVFNKGAAFFPKSADCHFGLGLAYQVLFEDELSEKEFINAINIDPKHLDARLSLSSLYADMGEMQKAQEQLKKILEIDPDYGAIINFKKNINNE